MGISILDDLELETGFELKLKNLVPLEVTGMVQELMS
jgi:hypothetical protein